MEVILLEKVSKLGELGDKVSVNAGYGRNFLLPKGKAVAANKANLAKFEARRAELEAAAKEALQTAQARATILRESLVTIAVQAGGAGKLFGSIGAKGIAEALTAAGHDVDKNEVKMPAGSLRNTGEYTIPLQLHSDVTVDVTIQIVAE
jgi:large subunit ribosomal protein L9